MQCDECFWHYVSVGELIVSSVVPVASLLVGSFLTYWLNIRTKQHDYAVDLFNQAITAVAVADSGRHYIRDVAMPKSLKYEEYINVRSGLAIAAIENHTRQAGEARAALARVYQYEPGVKPYYQDAMAVIDHPEEIITFLVEARDRIAGSRWKLIKKANSVETPDAADAAKSVVPFGAQFMIQVPRSGGDDLGTAGGRDADDIDFD